MNSSARRVALVSFVAVVAASSLLTQPALADGTYQTLPFSQNWSDPALITANNDWSGVPGIIGFRGDSLTAANDVDARTVVAPDEPGVVNVTANLSNPSGSSAGGIAELVVADPVVAFQGSGTADAPYLLLHLNTTGKTNIVLSFNARDLDGSTDNSVQQVAVLYRVGATGNYTNIPAAYIADATTGPSLATLVTPVSVTLPAACENQAQVQIRIVTTNASGNDEWVGIDDISVTGTGADTAPSVVSTVPADTATGVAVSSNITVTFTEPVTADATSFTLECPAGSARPFGVTGSGTATITIDPTTDLPIGTSCNVGVIAANVTDLDGTLDPMASGYAWTFDTASAVPSLSIDNVTKAEGNSGPTTFTFTVSLSVPAPVGGVTFNIATADGTATVGDNDYVANSLTGQTILEGGSSYTFDVTVNGDTTVELDETFIVNVTGVTGANVNTDHGTGTITNDDVALLKIGEIQGSGTASTMVGVTVTTRGIVTARKANGFFIQEADGAGDGDPATSDGIFVFTSSAPASTIAVGDTVQVQGKVSEYYGFTELVGPLAITEIPDPPAALPTPIVLTTTLPSAAPAVWEQLENLEGMRVRVPSMTVAVPTTGYAGTHYTTGTAGNGIFYGVVTGVARPMREEGFPYPDAIPVGSTIPRWDANPELIKVDSDALTGSAKLNVASRTVLTEVVGPLDYTFDRYTILPDPLLAGVTAPPVVATPFTPIAVTPPAANEFTVASYNLQRFYDDVNDPVPADDADENGTTPEQFAARLAKASLHIRDFMKMPDIVGLIEVENISALQRLAAQISADAVAAGQPDPAYASYLVEGFDPGGIDVGYLVKTSSGRVTDITVSQELADSVLHNPDSSTSILHDRPPLMLRATVHSPAGGSYPVTVVLNHLRSLNDVDTATVETPKSYGWPTKGDRVRAKRLAQAVDLANFVQARQTVDPTERIILMGDMNAFEVNDGFVHMMGTMTGTAYDPSATLVDTLVDGTTWVPGDGIDLVEPNLVNLLSTVANPDERYGYVFDVAAQNLDQMSVSAGLVAATKAFRMEHARVNADFHEIDRSTTDRRLSDHDPIVGYFTMGPMLAPVATPIVVGATKTFTGSGFTAGSILKLFVSTAAGPLDTNPSGWTPTTWSPTQLTWDIPANLPLAQGFATVMVVNTDEGYATSNVVDQLVYGDVTDGLPTILTVNGTALSASNQAFPGAHVETVLTPGSTVTVTGTGFDSPLVNLFTVAGNFGPLTPLVGWTATELQVVVPAGVPAGPGTFQVVNAVAGWPLSNAVTTVLRSQITVTSVNVSGSTVEVVGDGFCGLTAINLFNLQGGVAVNLGGLHADGTPLITLNVVDAQHFNFLLPGTAQAGAAYVQALNPPYTPFAASGTGPGGAFLIP